MSAPSSSVVLAGCLLGLVALAGVVLPRPAEDSAGPDVPALVAPSSAWARRDLRECKPQGPLALSLEQFSAWDADGRLEVAVELATFLPLADVRVRVVLPDGGELLGDPSSLLAAEGGWGELPAPGSVRGHASGSGVSARVDDGHDDIAPVDGTRRALLPGERAEGRLVLRLRPDSVSQEVTVEAEGSFANTDGVDERVVVQRRLVWGEPADPIADEVVSDRVTGAKRRQVVLAVSHRPER